MHLRLTVTAITTVLYRPFNPPMRSSYSGNLLLVSNHPSDTAYAWWLMELFWLSIAEQFTQNGNRAYLAYPEITRLSPAISKAPIDTIELTIPWTNREQATATKRFIRENNISFIYLTDQPFFNHQYAIFRALGVEHIIVHDHTPGDRPPVTGLKGLLKSTRNTLPWLTADSVLCVSEHMRQRNMANARIPEKKCQVVQNGIPPLNCTQATTPALRESIGADQNSILVTTTGRAHPYKRFDFIINVAHELKKLAADIDVFFLLAGDGPAMPELQQQINRLQLQQSVHLLGYRSDITDILCASD
ncbi:MAG TPA: glycosyltransferase, partial [Thiotrichales bacterium]|nr:glycosyltransferase [Thiotrichales bacterium]